jgi:hypothetical protein
LQLDVEFEGPLRQVCLLDGIEAAVERVGERHMCSWILNILKRYAVVADDFADRKAGLIFVRQEAVELVNGLPYILELVVG